MAVNESEREYFELTVGYWANLAVAGLCGGLLMGGLLAATNGSIQAVATLYGLEATTYVWGLHLWHAVVFAFVYGTAFFWRRLEPFRLRILSSTTIGITWGGSPLDRRDGRRRPTGPRGRRDFG